MAATKSEINPSARYQLMEQIGFILRRATQRHLTIFSERIPDLTPTQFAALAKLCELRSISQNELGRQTAMDAATIKGVIERLGKRGYVTTKPNPNDMRRIVVTPSESGLKAFESYVEAACAITRETLEPLNQSEQSIFLKLLRKIT